MRNHLQIIEQASIYVAWKAAGWSGRVKRALVLLAVSRFVPLHQENGGKK